MSKTYCKVMFGVFIVFTAAWLYSFVKGTVSGKPNIDELTVALCGVVICQLYWNLWHRPVIENKQYVLIKYKEPELKFDLKIDDFVEKYDEMYYRRLADLMKYAPSYSFDNLIKIKED